ARTTWRAAPRVVKRHGAAGPHERVPNLPILAAALRAVIAVDEHEVDRRPAPRPSDFLTARDVPVDGRATRTAAASDCGTGRGGGAVPSRAHRPAALVGEGVDQVKVRLEPQCVAE